MGDKGAFLLWCAGKEGDKESIEKKEQSPINAPCLKKAIDPLKAFTTLPTMKV
jgi:hypothetical protein